MLAGALSGCGGGGDAPTAPPPAAPAPPTLPTGRVSGDTPVTAGCTGGDATGTLYTNAEVEPYLARSPLQADHLVAVWQQDRWSDGAARAMVSAVSFDGGRTWARALQPMSRCGGAAAGSAGDLQRASDPWVEIGGDGTVHLMALAASGAALTANGRSAMLASRSLDGGRTFSAPVALIDDSGAAFFNDKNTLTVDTVDPRFVYAVWDRLEVAGNGPTWLARSTDAGASWEPAREIYRPAPVTGSGTSQTIGNRIVVVAGGADRGALVNVFTQIDVVGGVATNRVRVVRSSDRGSTWGAAVTVGEHRGVGTRDPGTGTVIRDGGIIPAVAAAPDGTLWVAWQDSRFSGGQRDAIAVSRSGDGGRTWSAPVAASRDLSVSAFTPTLHVRADGLVGLMYFDLRPDTAAPDTLLAAVWLGTTREGAAWGETPVWPAFDMTQAPNARGLFVGDYHGLASAGSEFLPLVALSSTDTSNRTDVYLLRIGPQAGGGAAPSAAEHARALYGRVGNDEFVARRQAFTRAAMERRLPDWAARVGWVERPSARAP